MNGENSGFFPLLSQPLLKQSNNKFQGFSRTQCNFQGLKRSDFQVRANPDKTTEMYHLQTLTVY